MSEVFILLFEFLFEFLFEILLSSGEFYGWAAGGLAAWLTPRCRKCGGKGENIKLLFGHARWRCRECGYKYR